jgi:hypothetical protein
MYIYLSPLTEFDYTWYAQVLSHWCEFNSHEYLDRQQTDIMPLDQNHSAAETECLSLTTATNL